MSKKLLVLFLCLALLTPVCALGETAFTDFSEAFPDQFLAAGETPVKTDTLYQSENIRLEISVTRVNNSDVYVADLYLKTVEPFQRAFGGGKWRTKMQSVKTIATDSGAILALTGANAHNFNVGWVIANVEVKRKTANNKRDLLILYKNGEMATIAGSKLKNSEMAAAAEGIWQTFLFGPALLKDGAAIEKFSSGVSPANPRAAIGYYAPGHYCLVQVDGRGTKSAVESGKKNTGMTLKQLSAFMAELGCTVAYNLDGGQSALMWYNGQVVSNPYKGGRSIGDIVIIKE